MNLQVRNPRAYELARRIAIRRGTTITDAVISALEDSAARDEKDSMVEGLRRIHEELRRISRPGGRLMTKEEIDEMWGHPPDPA